MPTAAPTLGRYCKAWASRRRPGNLTRRSLNSGRAMTTAPSPMLYCGWRAGTSFSRPNGSGFGRATTATDAQVERELRGGILAASQEGRQFLFVAVTPDFHHEVDVRALVPPGVARSVRWLRWGDIAGIVQKRHLAATGTIDALPPLFLRQSRFRFNGFQGLPGNLESPPTTLFLKDGRS